MTVSEYMTNVRRYPRDLALALVSITIGVMHVLSDPARVSSPAFRYARELAPMWVHGIAFVAIGVLLLVALHRGHARLVWAVRTLGPALYVLWAGLWLLAALVDDRASYIGVPTYLYLAYRHYYAPSDR